MTIIHMGEEEAAAEEGPSRAGQGGDVYAEELLLSLSPSQTSSSMSVALAAAPTHASVEKPTPWTTSDSQFTACQSPTEVRRYASDI